ncbi:DUF6233 domain-containing protein [Streptomyces rhizosphaerihabitans]|uniref:DUF6233 domain-containing protein n=1 Tax=Streptomyces rhizosphaerihabitans TaxID=1266770 RepID=UPI0021C16D8A|nr:DUF6233 domain-containing protein [Streptomyces rhizosphaerihabitans]MCT9009142.1 DUF6233 domain-containing protein [Streptomyces rhizosphaerihabitans]
MVPAVHVGGCYTAGERRRPVPRDEARRLLTAGVRACGNCQPDTALQILDLSAGPDPSTSTCPGSIVGPCSGCQRRTHKYGNDGLPLCQ